MTLPEADSASKTRTSIRREEDVLVKSVAERALNDWLAKLSRRVIVWIAVTGLVGVGASAWAVSAWATNYKRDVDATNERVDRIERQQEAMLVAMRELTNATRYNAAMTDSLRITLRVLGTAR